jgi:hypothetical protein
VVLIGFSAVKLQKKCAYYASGFANMWYVRYFPAKTGLCFPGFNGNFFQT